MTPARSAYLASARSLIGLTGSAFADALLPTSSDAVRAELPLMSTCELAAAAAIRAAFGLPDPLPYEPGGDHAARALYGLTGGTPWAPTDGLRLATLDAPPCQGDLVWYGPSEAKRPDGSPLHPEHVDAAVLYPGLGLPGGALELQVIAGGQPDGAGHYSAIAEVTRTLDWRGGRWWCRATGRVVWCCGDADAIAAHVGWGVSG